MQYERGSARMDGLCNTLTTVLKDNYLLEIEDDSERNNQASH